MAEIKVCDLLNFEDGKANRRILGETSFILHAENPSIEYLTYKKNLYQRLTSYGEQEREKKIRNFALWAIENQNVYQILHNLEERFRDFTFDETRKLYKRTQTGYENKLPELENIEEYYKNFRSNIKRAKTRIFLVPEAVEIFNKANTILKDEEKFLDYNTVNNHLEYAYSKIKKG